MSSAIGARVDPATRLRTGIGASKGIPLSPARPLMAWVLLVVIAAAWGAYLNSQGDPIRLGAAPLFGKFELRLGPATLIPIGLGVAASAWGPMLATRLSWRWLLLTAMAGAAMWGLALAVTDGASAIVAPVLDRHDYLASLPMVGDPQRFLTGFVEQLPDFSLHVQGHPPGLLLAIWALARTGLPIAATTTAGIVMVGASTVAAALIVVRTMTGESNARAAAPFLCFAPIAIWVVTSADGIFMGVAAWSVALFALAVSRRDRWSGIAAVASGVLFGIGILMSYGVVAIGGVVVAIAVAQGRIRPLLLTASGVAIALGSAVLAGFWWLDGLEATRARYWLGVASTRPYGFFFVSNLAAFALALGPAVFVAIRRLDDRRMRLVTGAALAGVLLANLSGLSKGEVERIWLPFAPWLLVACAVLPSVTRRWTLSLQVATAIAIQVVVRTPW